MKTKIQVTQDNDKLIDLICDFNIHESIEKEDLIELIKYQRQKIREMEEYISDEVNRVRTMY